VFKEEADEGMSDCWAEFAWIEFSGQSVEWDGIASEKPNLEDCLGIGKIQACKV